MKVWQKLFVLVAIVMLLPAATSARADDDDQIKMNANPQETVPELTSEQMHAVGIAVAHPLPAKVPARERAIGRVLDAALLQSDVSELSSADAAVQTATAEAKRLQGLYDAHANASLKVLQAARAEQVRAQAKARSEHAHFGLRWGPLARMNAAARSTLVRACVHGDAVLLRADLPGVHSIGKLPNSAVVDVDGIEVPGRVLGVLRESGGVQSVGLLVKMSKAPQGLGSGARIPVFLLQAEHDGLLVPRDAMIYEQTGTFVYRQMARKAGDAKTRYEPVKVTLLRSYGDGWLVRGLDKGDEIVVHGAGVLWSLQAIGTQVDDDDD